MHVTACLNNAPTHRIPDSSSAYPWLHLHVKPPMVFLHRPLLHIPGNSVHSLMSLLRSIKPGPCTTKTRYYDEITRVSAAHFRTQFGVRGRAASRTGLALGQRAATPRLPDGRATAQGFRIEPVQRAHAGPVSMIREAFLLSRVQTRRSCARSYIKKD